MAAAIAGYPFLTEGSFTAHWLQSWALGWLLMLPVVVFAARYSKADPPSDPRRGR
jgi:hypothetical protein